MALRDPRRAIVALLSAGPMSAEELEARIEGGAALAEEMGAAGEIVRGEDGRAEMGQSPAR